MQNIQKLFSGTISPVGFWKTVLLTMLSFHVLIYVLNVLAGAPFWPADYFTYVLGTNYMDSFFDYVFDYVVFPYLTFEYNPWYIQPIALSGLFIGITVCTGAFVKRLRDARVPVWLAVAFPTWVLWLVFDAFGWYSLELSNAIEAAFNWSPAVEWTYIIVLWVSIIAVVVGSFLPSKK